MAEDDKTTVTEIIFYIVIIVVVFMAAQHLNVVVSGSMEPVFYRGDIVMVEKTDFFGLQEFSVDDVKVGDIVVYNAKWYNQPVIHRVINITHDANGNTLYLIKGDHNSRADPLLVTKDQIKQRVVTVGDTPVVIPKIGYVNLWVKGL